MEDHEARRKIIREWMALPKDKRHTDEQVVAFAKRRPSKTSSIAVEGIQTTNFGAIPTRKLWNGSCLALAGRDGGTALLEPTDTLHRVRADAEGHDLHHRGS